MVPDVFLAEREPESARERHLRGPRTIQRETRDPKSDQLLRSWKEWFEPGQTPRRDGDERLFYRDGSRKAERHWNKGLPIGVWQSWFPDGTLESEVVFAGPETEAAMRWFHPSGALAAEGMGIQGVRSGPWTYWYEDGQKRQEGCYVGGLKEGEWVLWREDGREEARGSYLADRRVGDWTRAGR